MTHEEHIHLIKKAITEKGGIWADFGSGDGAFTLALRDLAGKDCHIYSVDKEAGRLARQKKEIARMFPYSEITYLHTDFTEHLALPLLDGILMANSLHYVGKQADFMKRIRQYLKPSGTLIIVEYNTDTISPWVPYPVPYALFEGLRKQAKFTKAHMLEKIPSAYWEEMYSAEAEK